MGGLEFGKETRQHDRVICQESQHEGWKDCQSGTQGVYRAFLDPEAVAARLSPDNMTGHVDAFDARERG